MLRALSIRSRLMLLSLLLISSLIVTNLVLIQQTRVQTRLIGQQAQNIDLIVRADAAVKTFGDLKYWLTDLVASGRTRSEQSAQSAHARLTAQLEELESDMPSEVTGLAGQLTSLIEVGEAAAAAYTSGDRLVGDAMMSKGRGHILAVDSRLSTLVGQLRAEVRRAAEQTLPRTEQGIRVAMAIAAVVTLVAAAFTLLIVHSVATPLRQMVGVIREMTAGRMDVPIPAPRRDELGEMARVLGLFRENVVRREQAEKTQARLREVIENISEGFGLYDAEDRLVLSNRRYRERLHHEGISAGDTDLLAPGTPFETVIRATAESGAIPAADGRVEDWIAERMAVHRSPAGPLVQRRRDGTWFQINEHKTADGGTVAIYTDITDLKQWEQELAQKTAILEATLENMDEGISMFDADIKLIVHNQKFLELWDYPADLIKAGVSGFDFIRYGAKRGEYGPGDPEELTRERIAFITSFKAPVYEHTRPNGRTIELRRTPLQTGGFVTTYTDITARKRAEQALRESEARLHAIAEHSPAVMCLKDTEGRYTFVNPKFEQLHGVSAQEVVGKTAGEVFPAEFAEPFEAQDRSVLDTAQAVEREQRVSSLAGPLTFIEVKFPILDAQDRAIAVGLIGTDITERKRAEESLHRTNREKDAVVAELQAVLDNIAYGILFMDKDLNVRMDNRAYREIWQVPEGFYQEHPALREGMECARRQGLYQTPDEDWEAYAAASIATVRKGDNVAVEQRLANGRVLQRRCIALPDGGRMATYFDITELKNREAELDEAIAHKDQVLAELQAVLDTIDYGVLFMDAELRIRLANRAYREIWDMPEDFFAGNPTLRDDIEFTLDQGLYEASGQDWEEFIAGRLDEVRRAGGEPVVQRLANGKVVQRQSIALPDGGRMAAYFDITELKNREAELDEAIAHKDQVLAELNAVLDTIQYGVLFMDADLNVRLTNRAYHEIWQIPEDFYADHPHSRAGMEHVRRIGLYQFSDEDWKNYVAESQAMTREGDTTATEQRLTNGKIIQRRIISLPDGGRMTTYLDITEMKRNEEALRGVLDAIDYGVLFMDRDLRIQMHNRAYREIWNIPESFLADSPTLRELMTFTRNQGLYHVSDEDWEDYVTDHTAEVLEAVRAPFERHLADGTILQRQFIALPDGGRMATYFDITEIKRAAEALRESEERLNAVVDNMPATVFLRDIEGRYILINRQYEEHCKITREEVRGKTVYEILSKELAEESADHDREVLEQGNAIQRELIFPLDDGPHTLVAVKFPILDSAGKITAIGGVELDITRLKKTEEALRASELRFRSMAQSASDAVVAADSEGHILSWNRAAQNIFGHTEDEMLGENLTQLMPERHRAAHSNGMKRFIETKTPRIVGQMAEFEGLRKDGTEFPLELSLGTWQTEDGVFFSGVLRDISERKQTERDIQEKTGFLELNQVITRAANEATDVREAMQIAVDQVCAYTGWPVGHAYMSDHENADALVPTEIWHLDDSRRFKIFRRVTEATRLMSGQGLPGQVHSSGKPVWMADVTEDANFPRAKLAVKIGVRGAFAFPVLVGREVAAVLEFFAVEAVAPYPPLMEVTAQIGTQLGRVIERSRAEERLRSAKVQAEAATQAKSQFLANMSHELRTPLNAILGYTELIVDNIYGEVPEKIRDVVERVEHNGRHLLSMINDVLDLSKIEAGHLTLMLNDYSMEDVVDTVLASVESLAIEKNLALKASVAPNLPLGRGDELRIAQVLMNLLGNALKFTDDGEVSIEVMEDDGQFMVSVADTGVGISEADQRTIFEEFRQADDTSTREKGGTGLGLAIARRVIALHGGQLWVESQLGNGSTFGFSLPVRVEQGESPA